MSAYGVSVRHSMVDPDIEGFSRGPTLIAGGLPIIVQSIWCALPFDESQVNALGDIFTFETNEISPVTIFTLFVGPGAGKSFQLPLDWIADKGLLVTAPDGGHVAICHSHPGR